MSARLTTEQNQAVQPQASAWVEASAGTGKTHVLTARMLNLLLSGTAPDRVLALTFTKAAAAEMSNRILDRLGHWAVMEEKTLREEVQALSGRTTKEQIELARTLFAKVLDLPHGLNIQTIHAFCQSLLGRFPVESGLPPQFKVMDERTQDEILSATRDDLMAQSAISPDPLFKTALAEVVVLAGESQFNSLMAALIRERGFLNQLKSQTLDGIEARMKRALALPLSQNIEMLLTDACRDDNFDQEGLLAAAKTLGQGAKTDIAKAEKIARWLDQDPEQRQQGLNDYKSAFLTTKNAIRDKLATKKIETNEPQALKTLEKEAGRLEGLFQQLHLLKIAKRSTHLLHIGLMLAHNFDATKQRLGLADYDDLIAKTASLLTEQDMAAWVLYKLDGGIDHILIDEAQDTNPEQWQVIDALAQEFFSGEGAKNVNRTVFAVGDVKQSIYGFQRAAPHLFDHYQRHFTKVVRQIGQRFENIPLDLSFRSTDAVLQLVDAVFTGEAARGLSFSERQIQHKPHREGHAGRVELWPVVVPDPVLDQRENWAPPLTAHPSASPEAKLATQIADHIKTLIGADKLPSRNRMISAGDILILVRRRTVFVDLLVSALKARAIPVAGVDRFNLLSPIVVEDLLALAQFATLPDDDLNLACLLKGPLIGIDEDALYTLSYKRPSTLWRALREQAKTNAQFEQARQFLAKILALSDFIPPFEFFETILHQFGGRRALLARLGREAEEAIDEFLAQTLNYETNHCPSLDGFLHWIRAHASDVKRDADQDSDAVRIMTVHGSKGLQAPIVILPDTCQVPKDDAPLLTLPDPQGAEMKIWYKRQEDAIGPVANAKSKRVAENTGEYKRLLYVALTRAEDRLIITGWETTRGRAKDCWYDLIEAGFERLTPEVEGDIQVFETAQRAPAQIDRAPSSIHTPKHFPEWAQMPAPLEGSPPRPLAPSLENDPNSANSPLGQLDQNIYERGRLIHKLLERLPDLDIAQRHDKGQHFLKRAAPARAQKWRDEILKKTIAALEHPVLADLFTSKAMAEVPLSGLIGDRVVMGQVDRLLVNDRDVIFIDYKTNRQPPGDASAIPKNYLKQMAAYMAVLERIYPDCKVTGALLWTQSLETHVLDQEFLKPYMPGKTR